MTRSKIRWTPTLVDYAKNARVLIDGQPTDRGLHIMKGYPGQELLDIPVGQGSKSPSVVMDLGAVVPISRLRIVWGDSESVPEQWNMEISEDGTSWKPWLAIEKSVTDVYDQWPGFEYYAPEQSPARYVRYVPAGEAAKKPVKLRQLSLFR